MEEVEGRPLMDGKPEFDDSSSSVDDYHHLQRRLKRPAWGRIIATHILVAVSTFLFTIIFNGRLNTLKSGQHTIYSPIMPAIEWVTDHPPIDEWDNLDFWGPPNEETAKLWDDLLPHHAQALQIMPDEAKRLGEFDTVYLKNGNPVLNLNVVHNVHCMHRIQKNLHRHYYYPNASVEWLESDIHHTRHCLEAIRRSIMCKPDLTLNRYYWSGDKYHDLKLTPEPAFERQCVNWDRVLDFLNSRTYDSDDMMRGDVTLREYEGRTGPEEIGCEWNDSCGGNHPE